MFTIETNAGALALQYQDAPKLIAANILKTLRDIGLKLVNVVQREHLSGQDVAVRTGTLRRAVFSRVEIDGQNGALVRVGVDAAKALYGRVQEFGGTITPTRGSYLTVPLDAAKTAGGVARFTARQVKDTPEAFGYKSTFIHNGVIFGSRGKNSIVPLFALKSSVRIEPKAYLRNTLVSQQAWIRDRVGLDVGDSVRALGHQSGRATPAGFGV